MLNFFENKAIYFYLEKIKSFIYNLPVKDKQKVFLIDFLYKNKEYFYSNFNKKFFFLINSVIEKNWKIILNIELKKEILLNDKNLIRKLLSLLSLLYNLKTIFFIYDIQINFNITIKEKKLKEYENIILKRILLYFLIIKNFLKNNNINFIKINTNYQFKENINYWEIKDNYFYKIDYIIKYYKNEKINKDDITNKIFSKYFIKINKSIYEYYITSQKNDIYFNHLFFINQKDIKIKENFQNINIIIDLEKIIFQEINNINKIYMNFSIENIFLFLYNSIDKIKDIKNKKNINLIFNFWSIKKRLKNIININFSFSFHTTKMSNLSTYLYRLLFNWIFFVKKIFEEEKIIIHKKYFFEIEKINKLSNLLKNIENINIIFKNESKNENNKKIIYNFSNILNYNFCNKKWKILKDFKINYEKSLINEKLFSFFLNKIKFDKYIQVNKEIVEFIRKNIFSKNIEWIKLYNFLHNVSEWYIWIFNEEELYTNKKIMFNIYDNNEIINSSIYYL